MAAQPRQTDPSVESVSALETDDSPGTGRFAYQPAFDGLRAIAVLLVMGFHVGVVALVVNVPGGWLGVDVFFVLSGYLITTLLLRERERRGRVNLPNFYARRTLRLAPLVTVLVAGALVLHETGAAPRLGVTPLGAVSILAYFSNWVFIRHLSALGILAHCWSLSIEEQFYLVWPALLLVAGAALSQRRRLALAGLVTCGIVAMTLYRRHVWLAALGWNRHNPFAYGLLRPHRYHVWAYLFASTFTRPDGLLFGCLLALLLSGTRVPTRTVRVAVGVIGVGAFLAGGVLIYRAGSSPYPNFVPLWGLTLLNCCTTLVVAHLVLSPRAGLARLLSVRPLTWVGRRAYGIYLLHPIVLAAITEYGHLLGWGGFTVALIATLALAGASYRWFEQPFLRRKARFSADS